jgi:hypothetical protein
VTRKEESHAAHISWGLLSAVPLNNPRIRARAECVHGEAKGRGLVVCVPVRYGEHYYY